MREATTPRRIELLGRFGEGMKFRVTLALDVRAIAIEVSFDGATSNKVTVTEEIEADTAEQAMLALQSKVLMKYVDKIPEADAANHP